MSSQRAGTKMGPSPLLHVHTGPDKGGSDLSLEILGCDRHLNHANTNAYERLIKSFAMEDFGQPLQEEK